MAIGTLIATLDCITKEIILDVQGGTASGDFRVMFPDATTQLISGTLPLTLTTIFTGKHVFWNTSLDSSSTVTSIVGVSIDVDFLNCSQTSDISYCLFNLNNAYEKAKCINKKQGNIEKKKLDRAIQLVALMNYTIECSSPTTSSSIYGCTDFTASNYNSAATIDDGSCTYVSENCNNDPTPCTGNLSIPNNNFESALEALGMGNGIPGDGLVSKANVCQVTNLHLTIAGFYSPTVSNISDWTGLEAFISLEELAINFHTMSSINHTSTTDNSFCFAPNLKILWVGSNPNFSVTDMDLTQNIALEVLNISGFNNGLITNGQLPDLSQNINLKEFYGIGTGMTSVDFSNNPLMKIIDLLVNPCTSFDFTGCSVLNELTVAQNTMTTIDVSMCVSLTLFYCGMCPNITDIYLGEFIDLSNLAFDTNGSNASVDIHVVTSARITQANLVYPNAVGTFVL